MNDEERYLVRRVIGVLSKGAEKVENLLYGGGVSKGLV